VYLNPCAVATKGDGKDERKRERGSTIEEKF
jgi:hypothetical protein